MLCLNKLAKNHKHLLKLSVEVDEKYKLYK